MKQNNVCKFIAPAVALELKTINFIFEHDPHVLAKEHIVCTHRIYLIFAGKGTFYFDREPTAVSAGKMVFGFAGESFRVQSDDLEYFYISFEGQRAQELFRRFGVTTFNRIFAGHEGMLPFWQENISRATAENIDLISESVLMYAFSRLNCVREPAGNVAFMMTTYAEENYADSERSLRTLAEEWGYNAKYLSDCFKKRLGLAFPVISKHCVSSTR